MGSKNTTLRPLRKDDPEADAIMRFHGLPSLMHNHAHLPPCSCSVAVDVMTVNKQQITQYEESFNSAAQGADTITKSQFDQIMQVSGQHYRDDDEDFAGLGISKRTMFSKIWKLFDVDKDGVMTVCSSSLFSAPLFSLFNASCSLLCAVARVSVVRMLHVGEQVERDDSELLYCDRP